MADKANPLVDELNKILTNTLDYKEVLTQFSRSISDEATRDKLREFSEVKEKESQDLMKCVKELGGRIESNERMTDQEAVYWVSRPLPEASNIEAVLKKLITAEENILDDYNPLLARDEVKSEQKSILEKHKQEAEANLKYFKSARN